MSYVRLIGGLAGLVAVLMVGFLVKDRFHQKALADAAKACEKAASSPLIGLDPCSAAIGQRISEARQAQLCNGSLLPSLTDNHRFAMQQACGAGVKRLVADRDAAIANEADIKTQLDAALAGTATAVARAEQRAASAQERTDHARKAIEAAPRDDAGRIHCDAECLRQLAG